MSRKVSFTARVLTLVITCISLGTPHSRTLVAVDSNPEKTAGKEISKERLLETIKILSKFFRTDDKEALDELWTVYSEAIPAKPYASEAAVQAVINHLSESDPRYAEHKPGEFMDPGILSELDRSGYIDRLYAGKK